MEDISEFDAVQSFIDFLKLLLAENGWTIKLFAQVIGCNAQAIGRWLRGLYLPSPQKLIQIAIKLNTSIDYMFGLSDVKELDYCLQNTTFYERFEQLRNLRGYKNYNVSVLCDLGNSSIYEWKHYKASPMVFQVVKVAVKLQGSLDYLFGISKSI